MSLELFKKKIEDSETKSVDPKTNTFDFVLSVMQRAWRERNPASRIKAARDALEKNPE